MRKTHKYVPGRKGIKKSNERGGDELTKPKFNYKSFREVENKFPGVGIQNITKIAY